MLFTSASSGTAANPIVVGSYGSGRAIISSSADAINITDTQGFLITNLALNGGSHSTNTGRGILLINDLDGNIKLGPITVSNVDISNFGYEGIAIYGLNGSSGWRNVSVTNCAVYANRDGIQSFGYSPTANQQITISNCSAHDNPGAPGTGSGSGIVLGDVNGATIQRCVAHNNGASNTLSAGPVGIWCYNANNVLIQNNESYNNTGGSGGDGDGFDLDLNTSNSTVQYNYSHGNTGAGYLIGDYKVGGNTVRYNVSQNDGLHAGYAGIFLWGDVYNTEVDNNWVFASAPAVAGIRITSGANLQNVNFRNNAIFVTGTLPIVSASTTAGALFRGNDYWRTDGSFLVSYGGVNYTSLSDWETRTGQEMNGSTGTGKNINPPLFEKGADQ